jgi:hypothetical protein
MIHLNYGRSHGNGNWGKAPFARPGNRHPHNAAIGTVCAGNLYKAKRRNSDDQGFMSRMKRGEVSI